MAGYSAAMRIESIIAHGGGRQRCPTPPQNVTRGTTVMLGIPGVLWHSGCVRAGDLRGASVLFAAAHCAVPQHLGSRCARRPERPAFVSLGWFYILIGLKMATDDAARRGRHARLPQPSCQPDAARGF